MTSYEVQHWLVWGFIAVLFMLGAWMKVGTYLYYFGLAALIALVESLLQVRLSFQIASFAAVSCILFFVHWFMNPHAHRGDEGGVAPNAPPGEDMERDKEVSER